MAGSRKKMPLKVGASTGSIVKKARVSSMILVTIEVALGGIKTWRYLRELLEKVFSINPLNFYLETVLGELTGPVVVSSDQRVQLQVWLGYRKSHLGAENLRENGQL
jgi:hypothetical protein